MPAAEGLISMRHTMGEATCFEIALPPFASLKAVVTCLTKFCGESWAIFHETGDAIHLGQKFRVLITLCHRLAHGHRWFIARDFGFMGILAC